MVPQVQNTLKTVSVALPIGLSVVETWSAGARLAEPGGIALLVPYVIALHLVACSTSCLAAASQQGQCIAWWCSVELLPTCQRSLISNVLGEQGDQVMHAYLIGCS